MKNFFLAFALLCLAARGLDAQTCRPVVDCNPNPFGYCDVTPNDPELWNQTYWWDPLHQVHDLSDGPFEHSIVATDTCGTGLTIRYLLFLDLDNNGTRETVVKSWDPPAAGTVNFDNANNPNYDGGTPRIFDSRPVPPNQKFGFALKLVTVGNETTATIRWNTYADPGNFSLVSLPLGNHKLRWLISNPNEEKMCEHTIPMVDCKKPTVVCLNGLSVNIMPTGMIQLWATDFLQYTEDNITPTSQLEIAIRKSGAPDGQGNVTGFPRNADGSPQTGLVFDCTELGTQFVELWSIDASENADYCSVYLLLQDINNHCAGNPFPQVETCITLPNGQPALEDTEFAVNIQTPGQPPVELTQTGSCFKSGQLQIPIGSSYSITPTNNNNPLNGVSTYDVVLMARHLLGVEVFNTPYKLISADVDHSNTLSVNDLIQTYRLILGITTEFPNNDSWRFVRGDYTFPNPNFPFTPAFPESVAVANVQDTLPVNFTFKAVKIADVNGSAVGNQSAPEAEDRSPALTVLPSQTLSAGQEIDLPLQFSDAGQWFGFQTSLQFDPSLLEVVQITPGNLPNMNPSFLMQTEPGLVRALWFNAQPVVVPASQPLFTLRVRALAPVTIRDAVTFVNDRFEPEAYDATFQTRSLQLAFSEKTSSTHDLSASEIFAPQPNPTADGFSIPVRLAEAADVQVQVSDLTGKVLYQTELPYPTGSHLLTVPAAALPQAGVYAWRVQVGSAAKSGKVVRM